MEGRIANRHRQRVLTEEDNLSETRYQYPILRADRVEIARTRAASARVYGRTYIEEVPCSIHPLERVARLHAKIRI